MKEYISFDSHKHYTLMERETIRSGRARQKRIEHAPGAITAGLGGCEPGTPVAVEAVGNWYWIVAEIEAAGLVPRLVHPRKAKLMMGMINKADKLDVHGLNRLQRSGTLPTVWIAPHGLRDLRELTRARLVLTRGRTQLKNRVTSMLEKHALGLRGVSDPFGPRSRPALQARLAQLPEQSRWVGEMHLQTIDLLGGQIRQQEQRVAQLTARNPETELLDTLPGVGQLLALTIHLEIGDLKRFAGAERLSAYSGLVPRIHSSGGRTRFGRLRPDVNRYLKWAFVEAANSIAVNAQRLPGRYVSRLYRTLRARRGHAVAVGAVARHLAEAAFHVLHRQEPYRKD